MYIVVVLLGLLAWNAPLIAKQRDPVVLAAQENSLPANSVKADHQPEHQNSVPATAAPKPSQTENDDTDITTLLDDNDSTASNDDDNNDELKSLLGDTSATGEDFDDLKNLLDDTPSDANNGSEKEDVSADDTDYSDSSEEEDEDDNPGPGTFSAIDGADVNLPIIGGFSFNPSPEAIADKTVSPAGQTRKDAIDKADKKSFNVGLISFTKVTGHVDKNGRLAMEGTCTLNNQEGSISVIKFDEKTTELHLKLSYSKPFTFDILPNTSVSISEFKLELTNNGPTLTANSSVFTPNNKKGTLLTFGTEVTGNSGATGTIKNEVPLTTLVPQAKGNKDAETITLSNVTISFLNPLALQQQLMESGGMPSTTITASAVLSRIKLFGKAHLSDSDVTITISGPSISLDSQGTSPIQLDTNVALNNPNIQMNLSQGMPPEVGIGGTLACDLPVVGTINTPVHGRKGMGEFELTGALNNSFGWGPVKFENPNINLSSAPMMGMGQLDQDTTDHNLLNIWLSCHFKMFGLDIMPILRFLKPSGGNPMGGAIPTKSGRIVSFSGQINGGKPIKPLSYIPGLNEIPGIKDFLLEQAELGGDSAAKMFIGGTTTLFGIATKAKILMGSAKSILASSTKAWKISHSIPSLKGSVLDSLEFETITFGYTKAQYLDAESGMIMQPGLNIFGSVDTSQGIFKDLRKFLKIIPKKLIGGVTLHPNPQHCKIQVAIPLDVKISSRVSLHNIMFEINGSPGIALMLSLAFITNKNEPPLIFTARVEFNPGFFIVSGSLQGVWKKPFGIPGLILSDMAVELSLPYNLIPPVGFGVTGAIQIGSFIARAAVKIGPKDMLLLAEISKWPLFCLPDLMNMVGLKIPGLEFINAIDICLRDVKFKFAPNGGQIGMIYFDPGISASAKLILNIPYIIKTKLEAAFNLDWIGGFKMYAKMSGFNLGPLKITGKGEDKKFNTSDDGAIFWAELSLSHQKIYISALVELFGSSAELEIDVGLLHIRFKMMMKLLGFLNTHIVGETYHKGWRVGFRVMGTAKIGNKAEATIFGDINTLGCSFAGKYDALTLHDIADLCHIPSDIIPQFGMTDIEFYVRAQG